MQGKLLLIAMIILLMLIGSLYTFFGFRKSVKRGFRNLCVIVGASMLSLLVASFLPLSLIVTPITHYIESLLEGVLDVELMREVLAQSLTNAVKTLLIGGVFTVTFLIALIVTAIYDAAKKPPEDTKGKSSTALTLIASAAAGIYLVVFAFFVPPVNIASEAGNITDAAAVVNSLQNAAPGDYAAFLLNAEKLVRIFISTDFIAADVNEKIDLVNSLIKSAAENMSDPVLGSLLANIQFNSADDLQNDAKQITLVMQRLYDAGITALMNGNLDYNTILQIRDYQDKDGLISDIYAASNYKTLIMTILTQGVRAVLDEPEFSYPEAVEVTPETSTEFRIILDNLTNAYLINAELSAVYSESKADKLYENIDNIKGLTLIPNDVYVKIQSKLGDPRNNAN
jgi:hypothetical protein